MEVGTADNIMNLTAFFRMEDVEIMPLSVYGVCILNSGDEICTSDDQGGDNDTDIAAPGAVWGEMIWSYLE